MQLQTKTEIKSLGEKSSHTSKIQTKLALPDVFLRGIKNILGNEIDDFVNALNVETPVSLRINPDKYTEIVGNENVKWCNSGMYLPQRISFTLDPDFHAGAYYIQEASSMFLEQVIQQYFPDKNKIIALDLCAAPGGKSTHLLSLLPENSLLVANDTVRSRAKILYENIVKWGHSNAVVTSNDPKYFLSLSGFFDLILVDAPCSGEGMFRKDANAIKEWSIDNVKLCAERQRRILTDVWSALKPGGLLIYCTCTYNIEENEANVKRMINTFNAKSLPVTTKPEWQISENLVPDIFSYRFYPHKTKGEGFCLSVMCKNSDNNNSDKQKENRSQQNIPKKLNFVRQYLRNSEKYNFIINNYIVKALPKEFADEINVIFRRLRCLSTGFTIGTVKGNDFVPSHALAMSVDLNTEEFAKINIDKHSALKFLHKDNILFDCKTSGYNLVCCNNNALGWIKNIGVRTNNLYPPEWRILMDV
ncbi:MAG: RsmB/NOP family class I SAM-dependent RNA methyltransferase [Prevotellaceae bacterium]|jgi:16S rRNA C967 or C1407 C5-methylase (RsmB/RsmF family)/NOL1/NOP2/fmu family ribosome biogenesis protein|nr:RsmB/NOP family class I SAM-dependent RNA methyltransferase [Prevotellaceae bacterium]